MNLTRAQKAACQAIVQIFETSKLGTKKAYSVVTLLKGDTGGLTYGKHQTTINSGNLFLLIKAYTENPNAAYRDEFSQYMGALMRKSSTLATDGEFKALLAKAGTDPVMQNEQDEFFDRVYWSSALSIAQSFGFTRALSMAVIYDSVIHGSWKLIRDRVNNTKGKPSNLGENAWIREYNQARHNWLGTHSNPLLRKCVYRQVAFSSLLLGPNWDLALPLTVRGVKITAEILGLDDQQDVETVVDSVPEDNNDRLLLYVHDAMLEGNDVMELQVALEKAGFDVGTPDGHFGPKTDAAVRAFQAKNGLKSDGIVGVATRTKLKLN